MFTFAPAPQAVIPVEGDDQLFFPVHRVYGIAKNFVPAGQTPDRVNRADAMYFMKPADAIYPITTSDIEEIPYPLATNAVVHEVEVAACLGKGGTNIPVEQALDYVWGWACVIDLVRKDLQQKCAANRAPWCIAKGFDNAAPISPVRRKEDCPDANNVDLWLYINDTKVQSGNTKEMIRTIAEQIHELSCLYELKAGDVILTGTPMNNNVFNKGDVLSAGANGIGSLKFKFV